MPAIYTAEPIQRKSVDFVPIEKPTQAILWFSATDYTNLIIDGGWRSMREVVEGGHLMIADPEGEGLHAVHTSFSDIAIGNNLDLCNNVIRASMEGRLFIKHKTNDTLQQLQTTLEDNYFKVSTTRPMDRLPWAKNFVMEAPEGEILEKPAPPSFLGFKRIINSIFGGFKNELQQYDEQMEKYEEQQNTLTIKAQEKKAPNWYASEEPPKSLGEDRGEASLASLRTRLNSSKSLDPAGALDPKLSNTVKMLSQYYDKGLKSRIQAIERLKEGKFQQASFNFFEDALGDAMLGNMIYRGMTDGSAKTRAQFYNQFQNNPQDLEDWKVRLLHTPAAKKVLAKGAEGLGAVLSSDLALNNLMNSALPAAYKAKEAQSRSLSTIGPVNMSLNNDIKANTEFDPRKSVPVGRSNKLW